MPSATFTLSLQSSNSPPSLPWTFLSHPQPFGSDYEEGQSLGNAHENLETGDKRTADNDELREEMGYHQYPATNPFHGVDTVVDTRIPASKTATSAFVAQHTMSAFMAQHTTGAFMAQHSQVPLWHSMLPSYIIGCVYVCVRGTVVERRRLVDLQSTVETSSFIRAAGAQTSSGAGTPRLTNFGEDSEDVLAPLIIIRSLWSGYCGLVTMGRLPGYFVLFKWPERKLEHNYLNMVDSPAFLFNRECRKIEDCPQALSHPFYLPLQWLLPCT
ncbi:hypothetical protein F5Y19DRAFT_473174 [Xylariaceae sp. FL1651]|nr:hypothetical protein F5Y19DRAFT_473174 [Xylariaceae sp. FL1651]